RLSWRNYLLLRVGDAGLLSAILLLFRATGTLNIKGALDAAVGLDAGRLGWILAGLLLAIWVKMGGWPFYPWSLSGRHLTPASHAWLFATMMPNLGIYLLYRVSPLIAKSAQWQAVGLWLGAAGAALSAILVLSQPEARTGLTHIVGVQGGLGLFLAAAGVKSAIWLSLLALTPLRLLLFLATGVAHEAGPSWLRRAAASVFALGGIALATFYLLITWWAQAAGTPSGALFLVQATVALSAVWITRTARQLARALSEANQISLCHRQCAVMGFLMAGVLASGFGFGTLLERLAAVSGLVFPELPSAANLVRYVLTTPSLWVTAALAEMAWQIQRRRTKAPGVMAQPVEQGTSLEEGLAKASEILRQVVEAGLLERLIALVVRSVLEGAHFAYRVVEQEGLEGFLDRMTQSLIKGAATAYRVVEQESLESFLRRCGHAVLGLGRTLQRRHTGRLRHNLLWVSVSMALALFILVLFWR
ncbi:MAG: proton-conducting transporter membrane subunit, partial [Candidatus Hadarchaeum sp.]